MVCVSALYNSIEESPVLIDMTNLTGKVLEQYGGALYERSGPNLDPVDLDSIPDVCYILPPQPEELHLFARIPLITQRLRDQVQALFEPAQNLKMAPGVCNPLHTQQHSLVLRRN